MIITEAVDKKITEIRHIVREKKLFAKSTVEDMIESGDSSIVTFTFKCKRTEQVDNLLRCLRIL